MVQGKDTTVGADWRHRFLFDLPNNLFNHWATGTAIYAFPWCLWIPQKNRYLMSKHCPEGGIHQLTSGPSPLLPLCKRGGDTETSACTWGKGKGRKRGQRMCIKLQLVSLPGCKKLQCCLQESGHTLSTEILDYLPKKAARVGEYPLDTEMDTASTASNRQALPTGV